MNHPAPDVLFAPDPWATALEKYAGVTHLTIQVFDANGRLVLGPLHPTPLFQLFSERGYDPGMFLECVHRCLAQSDTRPAVTVSQVHGLATVGTSLVLDGQIVGAVVGGYVFADFAHASDLQGLARHAGIAYAHLWDVVRQQAPVPSRRLLLHGELLQVLGDALLQETHRTRQYERSAAIIESSDDAIVSLDLDGLITSWNGGAERLFGYTRAEAIGQPNTMLIPAEQVDEESGTKRSMGQGASLEPYVTLRRCKDGRVINILLSVSPLIDAQGRMIGTSRVARDITARTRAENALRVLTQELEGRVEARTQELNESQQRLRALATELNLTEQRERHRLATELHDHLQQILVYSKMKLGQSKLLVKSIPACAEMINQTDEVLSEALQYTRNLVAELSPPVLHEYGLPAGLKWLGEYMEKYALVVTVTVRTEGLTLPEDQAVLLFQSVRELLFNAAKHAGIGQAAVILEQRHEQLRIEVSDQGAGFNVAAAIPRGVSSSTFGLFSIRERMKSLGGSFELESAPGQGTKAILTLPLSDCSRNGVRDEALATQELMQGQSSDTPPMRRSMPKNNVVQVLLVDDHVMVREGLRSVLASYEDLEVVGEARDGLEAVHAVDLLRPHVVIMDINMPKMNGIQATAQIKASRPDTIIIGLSVNAGGENQEAMMKAGAVRLLTKEAAVDQLYQTIHAVVHEAPHT